MTIYFCFCFHCLFDMPDAIRTISRLMIEQVKTIPNVCTEQVKHALSNSYNVICWTWHLNLQHNRIVYYKQNKNNIKEQIHVVCLQFRPNTKIIVETQKIKCTIHLLINSVITKYPYKKTNWDHPSQKTNPEHPYQKANREYTSPKTNPTHSRQKTNPIYSRQKTNPDHSSPKTNI